MIAEPRNEKFKQIRGPFKANVDIIPVLLEGTQSRYIQHLGIQARCETQCYINHKLIEIGKTDMLEYNNVQISSFYFTKDQPETTIVDVVLY